MEVQNRPVNFRELVGKLKERMTWNEIAEAVDRPQKTVMALYWRAGRQPAHDLGEQLIRLEKITR